MRIFDRVRKWFRERKKEKERDGESDEHQTRQPILTEKGKRFAEEFRDGTRQVMQLDATKPGSINWSLQENVPYHVFVGVKFTPLLGEVIETGFVVTLTGEEGVDEAVAIATYHVAETISEVNSTWH